jgi:UPF0716 protein FxsA
MAQRIGCLLIILPFVELLLLLQAGHLWGFLPVVAWVVLSAALGLLILRTQGLQTLARLQSAILAGGSPAQTLLGGAMRGVAGSLLLIPGLITDLLALLLLFPPTRRLLGAWAAARLLRGLHKGAIRVTMMGANAPPAKRSPYQGGEDPNGPPARPGEIIQGPQPPQPRNPEG